jgi:hypothetical protein
MPETEVPYDYWSLARLSESISCGLFLMRHEGPNQENRVLIMDGIPFCAALERGMTTFARHEHSPSPSDFHIAESLHRMLNNAAAPPISRAFQDRIARLGWARTQLEAIASGASVSSDQLFQIESFFSQLSILLSRQMLTEYYSNEKLRASIAAEPLLSI